MLAVTIPLTTNQAFDDYAAKYGWDYDNGGRYRDELRDWYVREDAGLVLLRQSHEHVALVSFQGSAAKEIWSGRIETSEVFDLLMTMLEDKSA